MRILILHQILKTNLQGYVKQLEGRINNQILRVKGLIQYDHRVGLEEDNQKRYLQRW